MFIPITLSNLFLVGLKDSSGNPWVRSGTILIQLVIFLFVGYQIVVKDYFPDVLTLKQYQRHVLEQQSKYEIEIEAPICIYGNIPVAFYYKLANPDLIIEFMPQKDDCIFDYRVSSSDLSSTSRYLKMRVMELLQRMKKQI